MAYRSSWTLFSKVRFPIASPLQETQNLSNGWLAPAQPKTIFQLNYHIRTTLCNRSLYNHHTQKISAIFKIKGQLTPESSLQQPLPKTSPKPTRLLMATGNVTAVKHNRMQQRCYRTATQTQGSHLLQAARSKLKHNCNFYLRALCWPASPLRSPKRRF